ncbi:MAG TPA: response regulator [Chloroflexota bacterium]|jgi:twitching motility two-component system response regulator PilH
MARNKILVVDDSPTDLAVMATSLRRDGFMVVTASDGPTAVQELERETFDLMLLDIIMPGTNGFQLCRSLRKDARYAEMPILLVTSKNQDADRHWGLKQGATEYVTKPFSTQQLLDAVHRHI